MVKSFFYSLTVFRAWKLRTKEGTRRSTFRTDITFEFANVWLSCDSEGNLNLYNLSIPNCVFTSNCFIPRIVFRSVSSVHVFIDRCNCFNTCVLKDQCLPVLNCCPGPPGFLQFLSTRLCFSSECSEYFLLSTDMC